MAQTIDIGTVLNKLNDTVDQQTQDVKVFGLRFLVKLKPGQGVTREMIVRKNVKAPKQKHSVQERGKGTYSLQKNGILRAYSEERGHPIDIKTAMIYGFRDYKESYWLNVFH